MPRGRPTGGTRRHQASVGFHILEGFCFGFWLSPDRRRGWIADQREAAQGSNFSCSLFYLETAEELAFGALHLERGFGVGLQLSEAL